MQTGTDGHGTSSRESLREALGLALAVWTALALGGAVAPAAGRGPAMLASFGLATALCAIDRRARGQRNDRSRVGARRPPRRVVPTPRLAGLSLLGFVLTPILGHVALAIGRPMGLAPVPAPVGVPTVIHVFCTLALAPCFEEHLYRARLLPALSDRFGPVVGLLVSSVAFALPHLRPWSMLGAGLAGLVLGGWMLRTARTGDCVAIHVGMNLAGLAYDGAFGAASLPGAIAVLLAPSVPH
jgi:membrane protease YdiL (CAAX protease family)